MSKPPSGRASRSTRKKSPLLAAQAAQAASAATIESILCSNPNFIWMMYAMVNEAERTTSAFPPHSTTVIGGAAFILHALHHHLRVHLLPKTNDIDIAWWYDTPLPPATFQAHNQRLIGQLRKTITLYTPSILEMVHIVSPRADVTIDITHSSYRNLTTTVVIAFHIDGRRVPIVDLAIKNGVYSQSRKPNGTRKNGRERLTNDPTYTSAANTMEIMVGDPSIGDPAIHLPVRVPRLLPYMIHQVFAYLEVQDPTKKGRIMERLRILIPFLRAEERRMVLSVYAQR